MNSVATSSTGCLSQNVGMSKAISPLPCTHVMTTRALPISVAFCLNLPYEFHIAILSLPIVIRSKLFTCNSINLPH